MNNETEYIDYYVKQLHHDDAQNAWFSLVEMEPSSLPGLIRAYSSEDNRRVRVILLGIIAEYPQLLTLEFLGQCLLDTDPETWKTALDGIVAVGSRVGQEPSLKVLAAVKDNIIREFAFTDERLRWIDEAIQQLHDESDNA